MTKRIRLIVGMEPCREGEYPSIYSVGTKLRIPAEHIITCIERRGEDFGTYGIAWFDVFAGDILLASMNALAISEICYADAEETP